MDFKRRVVQVTRRSPSSSRRHGLEHAPVESNKISTSTERQPVKVDRSVLESWRADAGSSHATTIAEPSVKHIRRSPTVAAAIRHERSANEPSAPPLLTVGLYGCLGRSREQTEVMRPRRITVVLPAGSCALYYALLRQPVLTWGRPRPRPHRGYRATISLRRPPSYCAPLGGVARTTRFRASTNRAYRSRHCFPPRGGIPSGVIDTSAMDDFRVRRRRVGTRLLTPGGAGAIRLSAPAPPSRKRERLIAVVPGRVRMVCARRLRPGGSPAAAGARLAATHALVRRHMTA